MYLAMSVENEVCSIPGIVCLLAVFVYNSGFKVFALFSPKDENSLKTRWEAMERKKSLEIVY